MAEKYYITTPIYYPSGKWHIGTCYTTIVGDAFARFNRMRGKDVFYLTGTDEHGQKIQRVAEQAGVPVKQYVDGVVNDLKRLWALLDISYDKFIRTTDEQHEKAVAKIFQKLYDQGDIYKSEYEGWYCAPCEAYFTNSQLTDGKCPDCGRPVERMKEDSYFFRIGKYRDRIVELFENNPEFLEPESRRNEMFNTFLKPGLQDLCVSRTSFDWGVKVPFDPKHVVYVWIDALVNYITALGYMSEDDALFRRYWPADVHLMAKEIVRFHSIVWPALLMALELPLPEKVFAHGWLLFDNDKMSKSKGNVVDPFILAERYGVDSLRYYMLANVVFGQDGNYTNEAYLKLINSDLANDLGNLVSRVTAMTDQYFGGAIERCAPADERDAELIGMCEGLLPETEKRMDSFKPEEAMAVIWRVVRRANKYIDENAPWALSKDETSRPRLARVLYNLLEAIRYVAVVLQPFLTQTPPKIFAKIGATDAALKTFDSLKKFGALPLGARVEKGEALFARLDVNKELAALAAFSAAEARKNAPQETSPESKAQIGIETFDTIELKVGTVLACEKHPKADKLLVSKVELGEAQPRVIVSGIAAWYRPEDMVGRQVVVVANLKPVKLRGVESQGMILCADDGRGNLCVVSPAAQTAAGSEVR